MSDRSKQVYRPVLRTSLEPIARKLDQERRRSALVKSGSYSRRSQAACELVTALSHECKPVPVEDERLTPLIIAEIKNPNCVGVRPSRFWISGFARTAISSRVSIADCRSMPLNFLFRPIGLFSRIWITDEKEKW